MSGPNKDIVIFVMTIPKGSVEQLQHYKEISGKSLTVLLLLDSRIRDTKDIRKTTEADIVVSCDFSKPSKIAEALLPYQDSLLAITCRSEKYMTRFAEVLPHVPYLNAPTSESLDWANDKYEMRKRFKIHCPKLTPVFTKVKGNTKIERERVIKKIGFPMVIKPANLAASRFVSICYHEEELDSTLRSVFRKLRKAYEQDHRLQEPTVIAEQYMEGDQYSVDSYVDAKGTVSHCPLVKIVTGKNIGHDDFYNYLQLTPTRLKPETVEKAKTAAEAGIRALGLRSIIAHTELLKIDDDWKLIEIGARMGGFRQLLHELSCDINHTLNDILVRIPKRPIIPKKCKGYACAIKWFSPKEGVIAEMKGIKIIEGLESFNSILVHKRIGDRATFAKNGGSSIFNLFMYNKDNSKLRADIRRVEKMVEIKIKPRQKAK